MTHPPIDSSSAVSSSSSCCFALPAAVQQHAYVPPQRPLPFDDDDDASPSAAATCEPNEQHEQADLNRLRRAEQDLSLYSAILGHRPTVAPLGSLPEDEDHKPLQISLHLNIPTRLAMPSLSSLVWRGKDRSRSSAPSSSRLRMPRLPKPMNESTIKPAVTTWFRHVSDRARQCVDDVLMRLAS